MPTDRQVPQEPRPTSPDAWQVLSAIGRRSPVIAVIIVLAAGLAALVSLTVVSPVYTSSATLIVAPIDSGALGARNPYSVIPVDQSAPETFKQVALQPVVADAVGRQVGLPAADVQQHISVHVVQRTPILQVSYRASRPATATRIAAAYSKALVAASAKDTWLPGLRLEQLSAASTPNGRTSPRTKLNVAIAALVAAFVAAFIIWLGELRRYSRAVSRTEPAFQEAALTPAAPPGGPYNGRLPATTHSPRGGPH